MSGQWISTVERGLAGLVEADPQLLAAMEDEHNRQQQTLTLVASSSVVDPTVLACMSSSAVNVTAEGYPGRRYHAGCEGVDRVESLAIDRACRLFAASYANVQPHSASTANYTVLASLLAPGEVLLGMSLDSGGHLTHGSPAALSGTYYRSVGYGLDAHGAIDFDAVRDLAHAHRPRVIICGATAYPRRIDFARFRGIADEVGAILLADISHTAGLVVTGLHPSPIDHAHITTTCMHKQLYGPRGGLILSGRDADTVVPGSDRTFRQLLQRAVFPFTQGAPALNIIAAKARALEIAAGEPFAERARLIRDSAAAMADEFIALGSDVVGGGTDNHIVLLDLGRSMSGLVAERALEECGIVVNKNRVPGDVRPATVTSGLRLGTNSIAERGISPTVARTCARLVRKVLDAVTCSGDRDFDLDEDVRRAVRSHVQALTAEFPLRSQSGAPVLATAGATTPLGARVD